VSKTYNKKSTYKPYVAPVIERKPRFIPPNGWLSEFQNLFDFAVISSEHGSINAVAGSGKTTAIVELAYKYLEAFPYHKVLAVAFNTSIRKELQARMPEGVNVQTCHSFGYKSVIKNWGKGRANFDLQGPKGFIVQNLAENEIGYEKEKADDRDSLCHAVSLCKTRLASNIDEVIEVIAAWNIDSSYPKEIFAQYVLNIMNHMKNQPSLSVDKRMAITFDDQVWLPIVNDWAAPEQYDLVLVDEAQDLSPARKEIIRRSLKKGGRMIIVGDKYQCVSVESMIDTPNGKKLVTDLKVGDEVLSYRNGYIVPQIIKRKELSYWDHGIKVITESSKSMTMSPNHKLWIEDFSDNFVDNNSNINIYAHSKNNNTVVDYNLNYYVAITKSFNNYRDALKFAQEMQIKLKTEIIHKLVISDNKYGTMIKASELHVGMKVPVMINNTLKLESITSIDRVNGQFIDLDVDDASNFFSDGILTHNSIYAFAGADIHALQDITKELNAVELPLTCSFRCAKNIVKEAQQYNPAIQHRVDAPDGIVDIVTPAEMIKKVKAGDAVVSRTNAVLVKVFFHLAKNGTKVRLLGKDFAASIGQRVLSWQKKAKKAKRKFTAEDLIEKNAEWLDEQIKFLKKKKMSTDRAEDEHDTINSLCEDLSVKLNTEEAIKEVLTRINTIFSADEEPGGHDGKSCVTLSSTHKFKGLERDHIYLMWDTFRPFSSEEETNIAYVGVTRAKNHLSYVKGKLLNL